MKNLTLLSPIKINNHEEFDNFTMVIDSYYSKMKEFPKHLIKDDSQPIFKEKIKNFLTKSKINFTLIDDHTKTNAAEAFSLLIEKTETKFLHFVLGDVMLSGNQNIFNPIIEFLEKNPKYFQICIGGTFISHGKTNKEHFEKKENKLFLRKNNYYLELEKNEIDNNTIWSVDIDLKKIYKFLFITSFWNYVMRTDVCQKYVAKTKDTLISKKIKNIELYLTQAIWDKGFLPSYDLFPQEWQPGYEFFSEYSMGFFNCRPYLYPIGRVNESFEKYSISHGYDIKSLEDI